jgi:hypothetical protein
MSSDQTTEGPCPVCGQPAQLSHTELTVEKRPAPILRNVGIACSNPECEKWTDPERLRLR